MFDARSILLWLKEEGEEWDYFDQSEAPHCPLCNNPMSVGVCATAMVTRYYCNGMMEEEDDHMSEEIQEVVCGCGNCKIEMSLNLSDHTSAILYRGKYFQPEQFFDKLNFLVVTGQPLPEEDE